MEDSNIRVIVAGSRSIQSHEIVWPYLDIHEDEITEVVSGGAKGVDTLGEIWAESSHIPYIQFKPDWAIGKQAGFLRNVEMAEYADALIAIWDGESRGTAHMIKQMEALGKPVYIYKTK